MFVRSILTRSAIFALAVTATLGGAASVALAQQEGQIIVRGVAPGHKMIVVNYRDLNLNVEAQRDVLYGRVGDAVRGVCNFDQVRGPGTDYRTCSSKAWTGAMPQLYRAFIHSYQQAQLRH